jgi:hypothetical protein
MANPQKWLKTTVFALAMAVVGAPAFAQGFSLNSDALASLEEPLSTDVGGVTVELTGLIDGRLDYDFDGLDEGFDPAFTSNFEISATTQLRNRLNVGVAYFGQYESDAGGRDHYRDNVAGFISGSWGTLVGGEVSGVVREETRRRRGTGNADLAFDSGYGALSNWGGGYVGQFGPARVSGIVDEDGNFDLGFTWSRPLGTKDYRFGLRYANATFRSADGLAQFDSNAISGLVEFVYGSSLYDLNAGYERLESGPISADRWFVSAGWQTKTGALTFSAAGHSAALVLRYDVARGLSLNLGLNHADAQIAVGGVTLVDVDDVEASGSLRYSF